MSRTVSHPTLIAQSVAERVAAVWADYQRTHDVTPYAECSVGVDPDTGSVFFGQTFVDTEASAAAAGINRPLMFVRVGRIEAQKQRYRLGGRWRKVT
jgi:hypothetical protein